MNPTYDITGSNNKNIVGYSPLIPAQGITSNSIGSMAKSTIIIPTHTTDITTSTYSTGNNNMYKAVKSSLGKLFRKIPVPTKKQLQTGVRSAFTGVIVLAGIGSHAPISQIQQMRLEDRLNSQSISVAKNDTRSMTEILTSKGYNMDGFETIPNQKYQTNLSESEISSILGQ